LGGDSLKRVDKFYVSRFQNAALITFFVSYLKVSAMAEYKFFGNWRTLINVKNAEYCSAMRDPNSAMAKIASYYLPNLYHAIHPCPYLPGPLRITNFTNQFQVDAEKFDKGADAAIPSVFRAYAVKGDFRVKVKLRNDKDDNIFDLMLAFTLNYRNAPSF